MIRRRYAGIGSRDTPPDVLARMTQIARAMEARGWLLHSGGADGADLAFECGVQDPANARIFLPWQGFNARRRSRAGRSGGEVIESLSAMALVDRYHPKAHRLTPKARKLMARNGFQVLGPTLAEYERASGDVVCEVCGLPYFKHPSATNFPTMHRICAGAWTREGLPDVVWVKT